MRDARDLTVTSQRQESTTPRGGRIGLPSAFLLQTLGAIDLVGPDAKRRPTVLVQPKRLALLVYLAARHAHSFVRRDVLLPVFWPDHDEAGARAALRQALHFLRSALGPSVIVRRGDDELAIASGELTLDAVAFSTAVSEGRAEEALELYRGDFLEGFLLSGVARELEEWIETERAALRARALSAALSLARREELAGRLDTATHWARRAAALAPYDESVQRRLITLLDALGDQGAAVHTYNAFHLRLTRELEVEPSAQTRALASAIRARRAATGASAIDSLDALDPVRITPRVARASSSMAVLPFQFSGPKENAFLGAGIADEIRGALQTVEGVTISSRIESEAWSERHPDFDEAALRQLAVDTVLSGQITQDDARLRVSVRLIDVTDGHELWRESYERNATDLFAIVRRLVQAIVGTLRITLADRPTHLIRPPTTDMEAYALYLRGRYHWNRRPRESLKGLEYFQRAIARDPLFALAHAGIADVYNTLGSWEAAYLPSWEAFPRARAAASKALEIDPALAEARTSLAYAQTHYLWHFAEAERQFAEALALRPTYSHAHHWHSHLLMAMGRVDDSLAASRRALELDPRDTIINVHLAWHYWISRDWDSAITACERTRAIDARDHWPPFFHGLALGLRGEPTHAVDELRRSLTLSGDSPVMLGALGWALALAGARDEARDILRRMRRIAESRQVAAYEIAVIHAALGEPDQAFDWLDRAYEERSAWLPYLRVEPRLDPLRHDERFTSLVAAVTSGR
jgi:DNA-binding SARP family transcriptional activator/Flp pilus assembly protein TadD